MSDTDHGKVQSHPQGTDMSDNRGRIWQKFRHKIRRPRTEPTKRALSKDWLVMMGWHFRTFTPCFITGAILWLNISDYAIGREIGAGSSATDVVLGVATGCAKIHEILMVLGLLNIARQAIQRGLTQGGILLGLLGAEKSLQNVVFVFKPEFRAALKYGFSGRGPQTKKIRQIVAVMFVVCSLCTVVGPASYVMMVPKLGLFEGKQLELNGTVYTFGSRCYPYIMINPALAVQNMDPYKGTEPSGLSSRDEYASPNNNMTHRYKNWGYPVTVNTKWPSKERYITGNWTGETNFTTTLLQDSIAINRTIEEEYRAPKKLAQSPAQAVTDITALSLKPVCRERERRRRQPDTNSTDFTFRSVGSNHIDGSDIDSRRLLLLYKLDGQTGLGADISTINITKIWITEGSMEKANSNFTDTILVVLQHDANDSLIVCSNEATMRNTKAISTAVSFDPDPSDFKNSEEHRDYFLSQNNGSPPRKVLYHKEWLDYIHSYNLTYGDDIYVNGPTAPRSILKPPQNTDLSLWAEGCAQINWSNYTSPDPARFELAIGGAFLSVISRISPSDTQYTSLYDVNLMINRSQSSMNTIDYIFREVHYPPELMIERETECQYNTTVITISHNAYGYKWKSISKILSMVALLLHVIIAIVGSLWQSRKGGGVIQAWGTVAEYGTLCLGTNPDNALLGNACAGITSNTTLQTLVGVRETYASIGNERGSKHLELMVLSKEAEAGNNLRIGTGRYGVSESKIKEVFGVTPVSSPGPVAPSPPPTSGSPPHDVDAVLTSRQ
ncbi:hypothetical protein DFP73DRAFT_616318 [Morchella snyderi]|nr:hypothetical protein DFP73DRAFT_616318 [Morchella snyderi]